MSELPPCTRVGVTTASVGAAAISLGGDDPRPPVVAAAVGEAAVSGGGCVVMRMTMASMEGRRRNSSPATAASLKPTVTLYIRKKVKF